MAKPTSALRSAGASLVPSPVTATTSCCLPWLSWLSMIPFTRLYLSSGDDLASTRSCGQTWSNRPWSTCTAQQRSVYTRLNRLNVDRLKLQTSSSSSSHAVVFLFFLLQNKSNALWIRNWRTLLHYRGLCWADAACGLCAHQVATQIRICRIGPEATDQWSGVILKQGEEGSMFY